MKHYGVSRIICGSVLAGDAITQEIRQVECPNCIAYVLVAADEVCNGYYDRDSREYVSEPVVHAIVIRLDKSSQCDVRGVFQTESGTLYTFTVRKSGHGDVAAHRFGEERFLAEPWKGTAMGFSRLADSLYQSERRYMSDVAQGDAVRAILDAKNRERREQDAAMHTVAQTLMTTPDTMI